ncbi:GNAT family N-acetyltransferase [Candidatus Sumerlaeota bacterium]|nr:GNAT family N-acetyltransferase [Candidatus Sumerlaeota bacterium]
MSSPFTIRPYEDRDCEALLAVWERALPFDVITREDFERRVLLDANREDDGVIVAISDGALVGFILCFVLRQSIEKTGLMPDRGFITAFAVDPSSQKQGVGSALLAAAEKFFRARDRKLIVLAPYTPNYFTPGVDKANYALGLMFLLNHGFTEYSEAIAMDASIGQFSLDAPMLAKEAELAREGITIQPFHRGRIVEYMRFMNEIMPGPWVEDARRNLREFAQGRFPEDAIQLACAGDRIIGYCQFEGEHFGPFGVSDAYQGKGIGTILLARTLLAMRRRGWHNAFVLWTGERAARGVYGRLGFTISRRFAIVKKALA